jgi:hypothetical protein
VNWIHVTWDRDQLRWRWRQYVSPKRWHLPTSLHGAKTQNNNINYETKFGERGVMTSTLLTPFFRAWYTERMRLHCMSSSNSVRHSCVSNRINSPATFRGGPKHETLWSIYDGLHRWCWHISRSWCSQHTAVYSKCLVPGISSTSAEITYRLVLIVYRFFVRFHFAAGILWYLQGDSKVPVHVHALSSANDCVSLTTVLFDQLSRVVAVSKYIY